MAFVIKPGRTPVRDFTDQRASFDLEYEHLLTRTLKAVAGGHLSAETDYVSRGATVTLNWDTADRLTTFTLGAAGNFDRANPTNGIPVGLAWAGTADGRTSADKTVLDGMIGVTRVLSRRWLMQLNYGHARETGYLTEPYKIVSIIAPGGTTVDYRNEKRPNSRTRQNIFHSSVYQISEDVIHLSYRYYRDDWGIKSNTLDVKYRHEFPRGHYLEPRIRYYWQSAVNFYTYGVLYDAPVPSYATSDYRYGKLRTMTCGVKYGLPISIGEFNIRAEYVRQSGDRHPQQAIGVQRNYDLFPPINIMVVQAGYSLDF
jgi:hypothetical protein